MPTKKTPTAAAAPRTAKPKSESVKKSKPAAAAKSAQPTAARPQPKAAAKPAAPKAPTVRKAKVPPTAKTPEAVAAKAPEQVASKPLAAPTAAKPLAIEVQVPQEIRPSREAIAARAAEIWRETGGAPFDNWIRAERELSA